MKFDLRTIPVLIALLVPVAACNTGTPAEQKKASSEARPEPTQTEARTSVQPEATPPATSKPNHFSLDTSRQVNQPMPDKIQPGTPATASSKPAKTPGPPGYITQKDAALQNEPNPRAPSIATLNQYETVYILETIFTDEQGKETEYPTWYKVERENKQRGWVKGRSVNSGGGG